MKPRLALIVILLAICAASAQAQDNCCVISVGSVQSTITETTVPPSGTQPGGSFISTETQTYSVACTNQQTQKPCSTANVPNNIVTATGIGAYNGAAHEFVVCDPTFVPLLTQPPDVPEVATFTNTGTSFTSVDTNGMCVKGNTTLDISSCIATACSGGIGSGPDPEPPCVIRSGPDQQPGPCSPIILDLSGKGFFLTNAANGVKFDISGTGNPVQMAWIAEGADNAFLALPGADGRVDNGKELFGNLTPQPPSNNPNGFAALAVYDLPQNGGNGDGIIDARDAIYSKLRLWIDTNHDGISQPGELHTLASLGVFSINLNYTYSRRVDQYGNVFRYKAAVDRNDPDPAHVGHTAYDVFFVTLETTAKNKSCPVPERAAQGESMSSMIGAGNF